MPFLLESEVDPDPLKQFARWFADAAAAGFPISNAMTLATATRDGRPAARVVLLKDFDEHGFVFYTNFGSQKSVQLQDNPNAALLFWWPPPLDRQVRIDGHADRVSDREADEYFATRPRGSQIGAWASEQSRIIPGREALDERMRQLEAKFASGPVPRPPHWGGFRLQPERYEFWLSQPNRLHDRLQYRRDGERWVIERLAP